MKHSSVRYVIISRPLTLLTHAQQPTVTVDAKESKKPKASKPDPRSTRKDGDKADDDEDQKWPIWARVKFNSRGKANLLEQHSLIRAVLYKAFKITEFDVVTSKAWPELESSREIYRRKVVLEAAKQYMKESSNDKDKQDKRAEDIRRRVKADPQFAAVLGDMVSPLLC